MRSLEAAAPVCCNDDQIDIGALRLSAELFHRRTDTHFCFMGKAAHERDPGEISQLFPGGSFG